MGGITANRFFHVYIIESPNANDLYDNRLEGVSLQKTLELSGIESTYHLAVSEESFRRALTAGMLDFFGIAKEKPIIHISAHGDKDGIGLTDGKHISWDELKMLLLPVNKAIGGGLIVSMSTCKGSSGCIMSMHDDDFPFGSIIGNIKEPLWSETNIGFATFYHLFKKGVDPVLAVNAMKTASGNTDFVLITAEVARKAYLGVASPEQLTESFEDNLPEKDKKAIIKV